MRLRREYFVLPFLLAVAGCGGADSSNGNSGSSGTAITGLTITPTMTQVHPGGTRAFQYSITGTGNPVQTVTWRVSPGGGTIDRNGGYAAPATTGSATVTVMSVADPTKTATAQIQITTSTINLSLSSAAVGVLPGGTLDLSQYVTITGTANTGLIWNTASTIGTVNAQGVFTPNSGASGSAVVTVKSQADPTIIDAFTVTIISVALGINPKTLPDTAGHSLHVGQNLKFGYSIDVTGTTNNAVTWAATDVNGNVITTDGASIDATGNYHAPSVAGTYYVTVRSAVNPAVKDTATLQVVP